MQIFPNGSRPSRKGPSDSFTGDVTIDPIVSSDSGAGLASITVRFAPGARTFWHTHDKGQVLHVTQGAGFIAKRGEAPQTIRAGDSIWIPADIEHWHGAGPDVAMTHVAIQAVDKGTETRWLEAVSTQDYPG